MFLPLAGRAVKPFALFSMVLFGQLCFAQTGGQHQAATTAAHRYATNQAVTRFALKADGDLFGKKRAFIENVGQYSDSLAKHGTMGKIRYGFEGFDMPLFFTSKGLIHVQRKVKGLTHEEREALERKGMREEEIEKKSVVTDRVISMEWLDANPNPYIIAEDPIQAYHTYGRLPRRARAYKTLVYKEVYPGIDIVYSFTDNQQAGVEYRIILKPGADIGKVSLRFGGDTKSVRRGRTGNLLISSDINSLTQSSPVCYYQDRASTDQIRSAQSKNPEVHVSVANNILKFVLPKDYRPERTLVIDPFISGTGNLTGNFAGKAKDVNFDYAGNVYVVGGGSEAQYELAKYDPSGALLWTFSGTVPGTSYPGWAFGQLYGGWTVEKNTGYTYLGQGINDLGAQIVRLDSNGQYDNFITNGNLNLLEMWKLFWICNGGQPEILTCGGSTSSNDNFGIFQAPSIILTPQNVTGLPDNNTTGGCCQDISDITLDPKTNEIYTYFTSFHNSNGGTAAVDNHIYKFAPPYTSSTILWNVPSGYLVLAEPYNRPYMGGTYPTPTDNSANILAVNSTYLFYWDGVNLQAYNKATGSGVGTPLSITANQPLMEGGIYADECNNVFVGFPNGTIKVYLFNGSTFDDAAAPDIAIPGFPASSVYSLAYDNARQLLYASGDGFVAAFDISAYCPTQVYKVQVNGICSSNLAVATLSPSPPAGSIVSYILLEGTTQISTNTTGQFTGLKPDSIYTIRAIINEGCSGIEVSTPFSMPQISLSSTTSAATCGNTNGSITALASAGLSPYSYSIDGVHFQASGIFNGLAGGTYSIYAKDANGCTGGVRVAIVNQDGPILNISKTDATCGNGAGTLSATATGGNGLIQFSIDGIHFQNSGTFSGLGGGSYVLTARDAAGCTNSQPEQIVYAASSPSLFGSVTDAICGVQQGTILAQVTGGAAPYQYSVNAQPSQTSPIFPGLVAGNYNLVVNDANGCTASVPETIQEICIFSVSALSTNAECGAYDGSLTATVVNGTAPFLYSLDGINFSASNTFTYLQPGLYTVTAKDANGTIATTTVLVGEGCPSLSATVVSASCGNQNGSITAMGINGTEPYLYALNGGSFQLSNTFTGLAPGIYVVTVQDVKGFTATVSDTVYNSCPSVTAVGNNASCGLDNGKIMATGSNGRLPYQYSLDGVNFQISNLFSSLAPGYYIVTVRDSLKSLSTTSLTINNIPGPFVTASATSASCLNNDGSITAIGSGGTGSLEYSLDSIHFQSSDLFSDLPTNTYMVYVQDSIGCVASQPTAVPLSNNLTLQLQSQDTICEGSTITLVATTNASTFSWTPLTGLSDTTQQDPVASPLSTTTYFVTVRTGPCLQTGSVIVVVNTAPNAYVGNDTTICYGSSAQLSGSGGVKFVWSPPRFLNDSSLASPTASEMTSSTTYSLVVTDTIGCSSITPASVHIIVTPPAKVNAGNDTAILVNQTLPLDAVDVNNSGFTQYEWSPSSGLNDPSIQNPIATITQNITYTVVASTPAGCRGIDTISIKSFALSDIFVPSGFTPNGDGHNDILRAIPIGIKEFKFFAVYNRWGQLVFYTTNAVSGWDGKFNGALQNAGAYVWVTEGIDYQGITIDRKGVAVLIR